MRAHYLQHVPFEGLGNIGEWLDAAGYRTSSTRLYESADFPDPAALDFLVVMGGSMSVNDEQTFPWLRQEKAFVRAVIEKRKRVLGVCLGAQLIASAMGARVIRSPCPEIGWFPVRAVASPGDSTFRFPAEAEVFHWHGETFELPGGAVRLARSVACENQAFQLGRSVVGLQFHLETTPALARALVDHCRAELVPSVYVQPESELLGVGAGHYRAINVLMGELLTYLHRNGD